MIFLATFGFLLFSFFMHILCWRVKMPARSSSGLLMIFLLTPLLSMAIFSNFYTFDIIFPDAFGVTLFYVSCMLVYICLYSAIEQHSPTLSIITHIEKHGDDGCDNECILKHIKLGEEIDKRLIAMSEAGWIAQNNGNCVLTRHGYHIATIFNIGAQILGFEKGG